MNLVTRSILDRKTTYSVDILYMYLSVIIGCWVRDFSRLSELAEGGAFWLVGLVALTVDLPHVFGLFGGI